MESIHGLTYLVLFIPKKILTVSDTIEKEYVFGGFIKNKIECIGNPIDIKLIEQKSLEYHVDKKYDLIFLGRLTSPKNPELLVEIFKDLIFMRQGISIAVVGKGDMFEWFENQVKTYHLQENIDLYGFLENPYPILNASKIMILPSKWEGYGLVAVEALSLGVPVVCSGAGGLKNIVNDRCGKICGFDKEKYVKEIENLMNDKDYYNNKSKKAFKETTKIRLNVYMTLMKKIYDD